jgi:hypothetical protein
MPPCCGCLWSRCVPHARFRRDDGAADLLDDLTDDGVAQSAESFSVGTAHQSLG